jgi:hypothetical protein
MRRADLTEPRLVLTLTFLAAAALTTAIALSNLGIALASGAVCGHAAAHCWACYAAPMFLALAAGAAPRLAHRCTATRR